MIIIMIMIIITMIIIMNITYTMRVGVLAVMQRVNWSHNGTAPSTLPLSQFFIIIIIIDIINIATIMIIWLRWIIHHSFCNWNTFLQLYENIAGTGEPFQNI